MKNKLDNILLSILWLLATTLAACFWFNTKYGFNIFSSAHWQHLAYMQAAQNPVKPEFYISVVICVIIMMVGLHVLLRPRPRKQNTKQTMPPASQPLHTPLQPNRVPEPASTQPKQVPDTTVKNESTMPVNNGPELSRPPRLNITTAPALQRPTPTPVVQQPQPTIAQPTLSAPPQPEWPEITQIFESAGYVIKPAPRIGNLQTTLFAIGTNETLWVGAVGVPTTSLQTSIDALTDIFHDTLDDIEINVHGFVISAPDTGNGTILTFETPSDLRAYMSQHPNPPIPDNDEGNFDAFSAYISTVIEYISKI